MEMVKTLAAYARPYSFKELENLYGVSHKTFKTWIQPFLEEIGEKRGRYFNVKQVQIIFAMLGYPESVEEEKSGRIYPSQVNATQIRKAV